MDKSLIPILEFGHYWVGHKLAKGVEGALDGFGGDDQGICGLVTMARVWVHVWLRYTPYSGRIAVLELHTSDSWALMRSSGAVRGVEGAVDGFGGGDQGICGLVTMERVWVHVWLRYTPYSGRVAVLNSWISAGKRNSGAIRIVVGS